MEKPVLLFDIGGTNMRLGISTDGQKFESQRIIPTPQNYDEALNNFKQTADEIVAGLSLGRVVGGVAGSLGEKKSVIYNSPNLPGWNGKTLGKDLFEHFNCEVNIENDTAMVGLGEAIVGAAKGYSIVAYVTVSTGVNGVHIQDGKILKNFLGYEIGHQLIDMNASTTNIEFGKGELEDFIGGAAIARRTGQEPLKINDPNFWKLTASFLTVGLYNSVLYWSPEILVIGGSLLQKIDFNALKSELTERLQIVYPEVPRITTAVLGEFGGLYGALQYYKSLE